MANWVLASAALALSIALATRGQRPSKDAMILPQNLLSQDMQKLLYDLEDMQNMAKRAFQCF